MSEYLPLAQKYFSQAEYPQAEALLQQALTVQPPTADLYALLSKCLLAMGDYRKAQQLVEQATMALGEDIHLEEVRYFCQIRINKEHTSLQEIREGKYNTPAINALRQSVQDMIANGRYEAALQLLRCITEARKVKTTTIIWIGQLLKELYFAHPEAAYLRYSFDELLLDEVLFYYLKTCKMHEKEFREVQSHRQQVRTPSMA